MRSFLVILLLVLTGHITLGQPLDPRIRIRVVGDGIGSSNLAQGELSSTVYVDEVSSEQQGQLDRVAQFFRNEQWNEAADMLARLSEADWTKLTASESPWGSSFEAEDGSAPLRLGRFRTQRYVPLRQAINNWLARLAQANPSTLDDYRRRVDPLARRWLETNVIHERGFHEVPMEVFHSSLGDQALLRLGDGAMERGEFHRARSHYRAIHGWFWWQYASKFPFWERIRRGESIAQVMEDLQDAAASRRGGYVGSKIPPAEVWARLTLVSILEGNKQRSSVELAILNTAWAAAQGAMAGRTVRFSEHLMDVLDEASTDPPVRKSWNTFGGNWLRQARDLDEIDLPMESAWRFPLARPSEEELEEQRRVQSEVGFPTEQESVDCLTFPIVFDDKVMIQDVAGISCLQLATGEPLWTSRSDGRFYRASNSIRMLVGGDERLGRAFPKPLLGPTRHTLSYANQTVTSTLRPRHTNASLIGFSVPEQGAIQFGPIVSDDSRWTFHGSPIHDQNRCWVGMRFRDASAQDYVACHDITNGKQLWKTRICSAELLGGNVVDLPCNFLLTQSEDTIYVSTHLGTVAALESESGRLRWVTSYPRQAPRHDNLTDPVWYARRDLTPCILFDDLLIAAPSDTNRIFALQIDSGEMIWSTELADDAWQLLGVTSRGQLVVSGRRLHWFDVWTGTPDPSVTVNPFPENAMGDPTGCGRGLLAGDSVYWPVKEGDASKIYVLAQEHGKPRQAPIDLDSRGVHAGNLLMVPGYCLIAGPEELVVFRIP